jgi:hypothetical protein
MPAFRPTRRFPLREQPHTRRFTEERMGRCGRCQKEGCVKEMKQHGTWLWVCSRCERDYIGKGN